MKEIFGVDTWGEKDTVFDVMLGIGLAIAVVALGLATYTFIAGA